jgi:hypothetical protein
MKKLIVYYAHSKIDYGSNREYRDLLYLKKRFPKAEVICPNNDLGELGSLKPYLDFVDTCSMLIVREYKNHVGKGAFSELARAMSDGIRVLALRNKGNKYTLESVAGIQVLKQHDWQLKYGKIITE